MTDQDNRHKRFSAWLLLCVPLLAAALFLWERLETPPAQTNLATAQSTASPIRGKAAPAFELVDLNKESVNLSDFEDQVVLVNFWGTTCAPCLTEIPWLVEFQERYGSMGFQVVAISMYGDGPEVLLPFAASHGMDDFKVVIGTSQTADLFEGVFLFPTTFILDRNGRYYSKYEGLINRTEVERDLAVLLKRPS